MEPVLKQHLFKGHRSSAQIGDSADEVGERKIGQEGTLISATLHAMLLTTHAV